jgi:3-oxoacyl-[acyl-carrier-protein] synthase-3
VSAHITHISYHLPELRYTNSDLEKDFPGSLEAENLLKIGIEQRRIVAEGEMASDIAVTAAERLFEEHNIDRNQIDFVLFCAQEFDHYTPSTACLIQHRLKIPTNAGALDYNLGCSGFVYGLGVAKGLIEATGMKNVLLLTSSTLSKTFHPKDRNSRYLFGDGAAATLIASDGHKKQMDSFIFGTDGAKGDRIIIKDGGARKSYTQTSGIEKKAEFVKVTTHANFYMNGIAVFSLGIKRVPILIKDVLDKANLNLEEVDLFVFHQANQFMIETICKKAGIPKDKYFICMKHCGNTVSSSIPIALYHADKEKRLTKGMKVMLLAFGTGFSWAGSIIEW